MNTNTNVEAIVRAIQSELFTAQELGRPPSALNALAIFKLNMRSKLSEGESIMLFDRVLSFIEDTD